MKKFAICCLAVAAVALFVPAANAATTCYHLTYFCDGVQITTIAVGGVMGTEGVGLWDFVCIGGGSGSMTTGSKTAFGTAPLYPYGGFGSGQGFAANFKFKALTHTFDLYGTFDGQTTFAFQLNSPYTTTKGGCNPLHAKSGLRPATVR